MTTRTALLVAIAAVSVACTRQLDVAAIPGDGGGGSGNGGSGGVPTGGSGGGNGGSKGGGAPTSSCSTPVQFLLVAADDTIFTFDPEKESAERVGLLDCDEVTNQKASVISAALDATGGAYFLLDTQEIVFAKTASPTFCTLWGKPPAPSAQAIAFNGGDAERLLIATDGKVYAADAPVTGPWTALGGIPSTDTVRALLGTGDGRLFAALSPSFEQSLRVARVDLDKSAVGTTWLVPSPDGAPDEPSGFGLYGDTLLIFTGKSLVKLHFSTGEVETKVLLDLDWPIVAVAAPACASTAR